MRDKYKYLLYYKHYKLLYFVDKTKAKSFFFFFDKELKPKVLDQIYNSLI